MAWSPVITRPEGSEACPAPRPPPQSAGWKEAKFGSSPTDGTFGRLALTPVVPRTIKRRRRNRDRMKFGPPAESSVSAPSGCPFFAGAPPSGTAALPFRSSPSRTVPHISETRNQYCVNVIQYGTKICTASPPVCNTNLVAQLLQEESQQRRLVPEELR